MVELNSGHARPVYAVPSGRDCPETPDSYELTVPQAVFNDLASAGIVRIEMIPTTLVDPDQCHPPSFIEVTVRYLAFDCNANGLLDECDIANGTSVDINENGIPDECEPSRRGDMNCDLAIDAFDIEPFILAVFEPWNYELLYPNCDIRLGDINGDGTTNAFDIDPFVELLFP